MVGASPAYVALQQKLQKVARYQEPVLIFGESGVGKEQLAAAIYLLGESLDRPFVSVNCPQYQDGNLTVSELFGHRKGAFTGAITDHRGAFEEADGGVLFLDEIGDLQANTQAMLLRALSTGEFRPLGAAKPRSVEVRVIWLASRSRYRLCASAKTIGCTWSSTRWESYSNVTASANDYRRPRSISSPITSGRGMCGS